MNTHDLNMICMAMGLGHNVRYITPWATADFEAAKAVETRLRALHPKAHIHRIGRTANTDVVVLCLGKKCVYMVSSPGWWAPPARPENEYIVVPQDADCPDGVADKFATWDEWAEDQEL